MRYDAVVIGAGVFGAWTAYHLRASGRSVLLLDSYGPGNSRASSGDESRVLRMGYGPDDIYTRWAKRSRELWIDLFASAGRPELFQQTGVLWTPAPGDSHIAPTLEAFRRYHVAFEELDQAALSARYPQISFTSERIGIFEPEGGALLARQAVQATVRQTMRNGGEYTRDTASAPEDGSVRTASGEKLEAGLYVFACGPWLPKVFPQLLGGRIRPTRQEAFYFGVPPGERRFSPPAMPVWMDFRDELGSYALPELDGRGFKLAFDRHGPDFDPDSDDRAVRGLEQAKAFLSQRFPALARAPLVESRVCQYENSSSGDFLIDRHPEMENVWFVGGGSGHGFKHGPAVGEYTAKVIDGLVTPEPRFSLSTKAHEAKRSVY